MSDVSTSIYFPRSVSDTRFDNLSRAIPSFIFLPFSLTRPTPALPVRHSPAQPSTVAPHLCSLYSIPSISACFSGPRTVATLQPPSPRRRCQSNPTAVAGFVIVSKVLLDISVSFY
ncbi:hypothetical protein Csa_018383 [Cucumis sativus]|uniref:Uncharacterized protein n=1 Tax=Cucumis sativus TaxID=3659 RepID=A0A0A0KJ70_CUCSA|nr:hypothetical protein Csa_018383 [Cucumis sativus]